MQTWLDQGFKSRYGASQFTSWEWQDDILPAPGTSDEYYADGSQQNIRDAIYDIFWDGYDQYASTRKAFIAVDANGQILTDAQLVQNTLPPATGLGDIDIRSQYYNYNWRRGSK